MERTAEPFELRLAAYWIIEAPFTGGLRAARGDTFLTYRSENVFGASSIAEVFLARANREPLRSCGCGSGRERHLQT